MQGREKRPLQTSQRKVSWKKMSLKAGKFLRNDCRGNNNTNIFWKKFWQKLMTYWVWFEWVSVRAWGRERGLKNDNRDLSFTDWKRWYCWKRHLRRESGFIGRDEILNKIFFLLQIFSLLGWRLEFLYKFNLESNRGAHYSHFT